MLKPLRHLTKLIFIAINILIAVMFVMGCYAKYFDPESWWVVGLFTLVLPYLLLVLIFFLLLWIMFRSGWISISIITIILCWNPLQHLIPFRIKSGFAMQKDSVNIRIMSWNVEQFGLLKHKKHPEIKGQMLDLINSYQPDIACFQEAVAGDDNKAINYVYDIVEKLGFKYYFYTYYPKLDFDQHHHFGVLIFSRYPIINKKTVSFPPYDYNSTFQYTDILKGADTIRVFNVHLQSLRFTPDNIEYITNPTDEKNQSVKETRNIVGKVKDAIIRRSVQARRIKDEMKNSPFPVLLCGDFNDVPNSYAYSIIGEGMQNTFAKKGRWIGNTFSALSPTLRIDNIFADNHFEVLQYYRVKKLLSDHYPVITDLRITNPH